MPEDTGPGPKCFAPGTSAGGWQGATLAAGRYNSWHRDGLPRQTRRRSRSADLRRRLRVRRRRRPAVCSRFGRSRRLQPPDPPAPVRSLLPLPRAGASQAQGEAAPRRARRRVQEAARRLGDRQARAIPRRASSSAASPTEDIEDDDAAAGVAPVADRGGEGAADAVGGGGRRLQAALVVRAGRRPSRPPSAPRIRRRSNPIDAFVRARLEPGGAGAGAAARRQRCSSAALAFDLTGLPPTLDEIDAFLADRSPGAYERAASTASSPRRPTASAWRWTGSTWRATPTPTATRTTSSATCRAYRDWVIRAFNATCRTTSSSPGSWPAICCRTPTREQRIATAFNRLHRQTNEGGSIEEEFRTEYVVDRVNTFGTAMLGPDARVRALPRSQVRPDHAAGLLLAVRVLQQHRRVGPLLALHQRDAEPVAAAVAGRQGRRAPAPDGEDARARGAGPRDVARGAEGLRRAADACDRRRRRRSRIWPSMRVDGEKTPDTVLTRSAELQRCACSGGCRLAIQRRQLGRASRRADLRPHRPVLARRCACSPPNSRIARSSLHQSRAWTDAGSRGFELTLDRGRPFFGLIHFWPGNAIAVRAVTAAAARTPGRSWSSPTTARAARRASGSI